MAQEEKEDGKPAHFTPDAEFQQQSRNIYLQWGHTLRIGTTAFLSWMQGRGAGSYVRDRTFVSPQNSYVETQPLMGWH